MMPKGTLFIIILLALVTSALACLVAFVAVVVTN
jgi:hypothetical protein